MLRNTKTKSICDHAQDYQRGTGNVIIPLTIRQRSGVVDDVDEACRLQQLGYTSKP